VTVDFCAHAAQFATFFRSIWLRSVGKPSGKVELCSNLSDRWFALADSEIETKNRPR